MIVSGAEFPVPLLLLHIFIVIDLLLLQLMEIALLSIVSSRATEARVACSSSGDWEVSVRVTKAGVGYLLQFYSFTMSVLVL